MDFYSTAKVRAAIAVLYGDTNTASWADANQYLQQFQEDESAWCVCLELLASAKTGEGSHGQVHFFALQVLYRNITVRWHACPMPGMVYETLRTLLCGTGPGASAAVSVQQLALTPTLRRAALCLGALAVRGALQLQVGQHTSPASCAEFVHRTVTSAVAIDISGTAGLQSSPTGPTAGSSSSPPPPPAASAACVAHELAFFEVLHVLPEVWRDVGPSSGSMCLAAWAVARMGITVLERCARAFSTVLATTAVQGQCASASGPGAASVSAVAADNIHGLANDCTPPVSITVARAALRCMTSWLESDFASLDTASGDDGQSGLSLSMMVDDGTYPQLLGCLLHWSQDPRHCLYRHSVEVLRAALAVPSPELAWLKACARTGEDRRYQAAMRRVSAVVRIADFIGNVLPQLARGSIAQDSLVPLCGVAIALAENHAAVIWRGNAYARLRTGFCPGAGSSVVDNDTSIGRRVIEALLVCTACAEKQVAAATLEFWSLLPDTFSRWHECDSTGSTVVAPYLDMLELALAQLLPILVQQCSWPAPECCSGDESGDHGLDDDEMEMLATFRRDAKDTLTAILLRAGKAAPSFWRHALALGIMLEQATTWPGAEATLFCCRALVEVLEEEDEDEEADEEQELHTGHELGLQPDEEQLWSGVLVACEKFVRAPGEHSILLMTTAHLLRELSARLRRCDKLVSQAYVVATFALQLAEQNKHQQCAAAFAQSIREICKHGHRSLQRHAAALQPTRPVDHITHLLDLWISKPAVRLAATESDIVQAILFMAAGAPTAHRTDILQRVFTPMVEQLRWWITADGITAMSTKRRELSNVISLLTCCCGALTPPALVTEVFAALVPHICAVYGVLGSDPDVAELLCKLFKSALRAADVACTELARSAVYCAREAFIKHDVSCALECIGAAVLPLAQSQSHHELIEALEIVCGTFANQVSTTQQAHTDRAHDLDPDRTMAFFALLKQVMVGCPLLLCAGERLHILRKSLHAAIVCLSIHQEVQPVRAVSGFMALVARCAAPAENEFKAIAEPLLRTLFHAIAGGSCQRLGKHFGTLVFDIIQACPQVCGQACMQLADAGHLLPSLRREHQALLVHKLLGATQRRKFTNLMSQLSLCCHNQLAADEIARFLQPPSTSAAATGPALNFESVEVDV